MKRSIIKIIIFVAILLVAIFLVFLKTSNKAADKNKVTIVNMTTDITKIKQNKTSKEILIEKLFGGELLSIMKLDDKNRIDSYLNNRKKMLPKIRKMSIRELLNSVKQLPHPMYYKKGDIYSEEIINRGESVLPELIELILDDQNISSVAYTDKYYYSIGDVAVRFIIEIKAKNMILHNFLWDAFKLESDFLPDLALSKYGEKLIFEKNNNVRIKNRKLLYEYIKNKKYNHPDSNKTK